MNDTLTNIKKFCTSNVQVYFSRIVLLVLIFFIATIAYATTPNPGHPWTEVGDGTFQVTGPTTLHTYTLPDATSTILTTNAAVTVAQGGTGLASLTANNLLVGNGASSPTFLAPGTTGTYIASNGTNWIVATSTDPVLYRTFGLNPANLTAVTAITSGTTYFEYMGVAPKAYTSCNVLENVTTAVATPTWAEVALFKGTPVLNGAASLTLLGFTSVTATYNTTGRKSTAVSASINPGDQLWVAHGSLATTPFQVRGQLADDLQSGVFQTGVVRPSLAATPFTTTLSTATAVPAWITMKCQ